jgi:hypothetical protein
MEGMLTCRERSRCVVIDVSNPVELLLGLLSLIFLGGIAFFCLLAVEANIHILRTSEFDRWRPIVSIVAATGILAMLAYIVFLALP